MKRQHAWRRADRTPTGGDDAPLVLFETLYAMPATLLRLKPQRGLAAGTARQHDIPHRQVDGGPSCRGGHILFSQEKDAKVIQGERPLDIPLMGRVAFRTVWAAIFSRFAGAKPEEVPRSIRKNRRLPPKPPMCLYF